jgi:uncharacterized LabA/DUF88 family protein
MAASNDTLSMALFCDFENVALGVRDAQLDKFDIRPVLERLLLKGNIVVKKAYCDWERYKGFKAAMHEANFELIEIPHVRQSGKNSADIRLVVDALDLCYTKSHVNTFVIISGDSDFSPLVSKLRENAKQVIGVGVKQSTSDLLVANCDEFIFYDDLVRESQRAHARREPQNAAPAPRRTPDEEKRRKEEIEARRSKAIHMAVETFDALVSERGDSGKIWASVLKEAIKRRRPDFSESNYGFRAFGNLLEEAQARGLLEFGRDEKSGAYVFRSSQSPAAVMAEPVTERPERHERAERQERQERPERPAMASYFSQQAAAPVTESGELPANPPESLPAMTEKVALAADRHDNKRSRGRGGRKTFPQGDGQGTKHAQETMDAPVVQTAPLPSSAPEPAPATPMAEVASSHQEDGGQASTDSTSAPKAPRSRRPRQATPKAASTKAKAAPKTDPA